MARKKIAPPPQPAPVAVAEPTKQSRAAAFAHHALLVEQLMLRSVTEAAICRHARDTWGYGRQKTTRLIDRVYARWTAETERTRAREKSKHVHRLEYQLQQLMSDTDSKKWDYGAIIARERLLADILGTKAPIKVDVGSSQLEAVDRIVSLLTPDQFQKAALDYLENVSLAEKARVLLRLPDGTTVEEKPEEKPKK